MSKFGLQHVAMLHEHRDVVTQTMQHAINLYADDVRAELRHIHERHSPYHIAQSSIVFGMCSPQADFAFNVAVTQPLVRALNRDTSVAELAATIRHHYLGLHNQKARRLLAAQPFILSCEDTSPEAIRALDGMGPKCTALASHLINPWQQVYTLDRHILRILCTIIDVPHCKMASDAAYPRVEQFLLDIHDELFGDVCAPFVSQWALWDLAFGKHMEHTGIF